MTAVGKLPSGGAMGRGDFITEDLHRMGFPVTRENYLTLAAGDPNFKLSPEQELEMPKQFRVLGPGCAED